MCLCSHYKENINRLNFFSRGKGRKMKHRMFIILLISLCCSAYSAKNATSHWSPIDNNPAYLFEGDIMIRKGSKLPEDRNAMTNKMARWPGGKVYYVFDSAYTSEDIQLMKSAMEEFRKSTCIEWIERTEEEDFVEIDNDMGCWSELGVEGGSQTLSLEAPLCMQKGVAIHEMMHTLGFLHEMSRPDRDEYISIHWDNIIPGMEDNFQKMSRRELNDLGMPYDYRSVMHYHAWAFSIDRQKPTCSPKEHGVSLEQLGYAQTEGILTEDDVRKINLFYEC